MRTSEDVEAYLLKLDRSFTQVVGQAGRFLVKSSDSMPPIAVRVDPLLVVLRVYIGETQDDLPLYKKLLQLNAKASLCTRASEKLEENRIVLSAALRRLENLDFNEIREGDPRRNRHGADTAGAGARWAQEQERVKGRHDRGPGLGVVSPGSRKNTPMESSLGSRSSPATGTI